MKHFSCQETEKILPPAAVYACIQRLYGALAQTGASPAGHRYETPLRVVQALPAPAGEKRFLGLMPSHRREIESEQAEYIGTKCLTVYPANSAGVPSHQGVYVLFEGKSGQPVCTLEAGALTALRTAASSAVAAGLLWPLMMTESTDRRLHVGIIGSGEQARRHAVALVDIFADSPTPVREISLWGRHAGRTHASCVAIAAQISPATVCRAAPSVDQMVPRVDLLCTVTASTAPVVTAEAISGRPQHKPLLIQAIGACTPTSRELSCEVVCSASLPIVVDTLTGALHEAGDLLAEDVAACLRQRGQSISDVVVPLSTVMREGLGTEGRPPILLFKSVGFGALDLALAIDLFEQSQKLEGA